MLPRPENLPSDAGFPACAFAAARVLFLKAATLIAMIVVLGFVLSVVSEHGSNPVTWNELAIGGSATVCLSWLVVSAIFGFAWTRRST